jgi:hypothetical protein
MSEREAQVCEAGSGIFLTTEELQALGIDPDVVDHITYSVTESAVIVTESSKKDE